MDLYTLTPAFTANNAIDELVSIIWTERYSAAGDVQLVVPATEEKAEMLKPGTFLGMRGTKEVMILKSQSIENGLIAIAGQSLVEFLNERAVWFRSDDSTGDQKVQDYTFTAIPGQFIANVVNYMAITPTPFPTGWESADLDWTHEKIDGLALGPVDVSGTATRVTVPIGPLYEAIASLAQKENIGITLYLESASPIFGPELKFSTYRGKDRTTSQSVNPLVRLSPRLDSIGDLKEVRSIAAMKNVVYVYYQGAVSMHLADPAEPVPVGFNRRVLVTDAQGEPVGRKVTIGPGITTSNPYTLGPGWAVSSDTYVPQTVVAPADLAAFRAQNARDALANHSYIRAIDGETTPQSDLRFGIDYGLGDVIELEGLSGVITKARVTEHIRSQDQQGEREYPTISVIA